MGLIFNIFISPIFTKYQFYIKEIPIKTYFYV